MPADPTANVLEEIAIRVKMINALANPCEVETDRDIDNLVCDVLNLCDGKEPDPPDLEHMIRMLKRVVDGGEGSVSDCYAKEAQQHLVAMLEATLPPRDEPGGYVKTDEEEEADDRRVRPITKECTE